MRTKRNLVFSFLIAAIVAITVPALLLGQNYFQQMQHIIFDVDNPQVRYPGALTFKTLGGTTVATLDQTAILAGSKSPVTVGTAAALTLTAADCGRVLVGTATSSTQVYTLPVVTTAGCVFTFVAGHASSEILVNAAEASGTSIIFTSFAAVGADADSGIVTDTDGTPGFKNTAASNAIGDTITILADGVDTWRGIGIGSGIWAAQ